MMVELLAAGLTGSQLSFEAADADPDWKGPSRHGELIILIDPAVVRSHSLKRETIADSWASYSYLAWANAPTW